MLFIEEQFDPEVSVSIIKSRFEIFLLIYISSHGFFIFGLIGGLSYYLPILSQSIDLKNGCYLAVCIVNRFGIFFARSPSKSDMKGLLKYCFMSTSMLFIILSCWTISLLNGNGGFPTTISYNVHPKLQQSHDQLYPFCEKYISGAKYC